MYSRVVLVDVDVMQCGLLQAEDVDHSSVQDVVGLSEELIKAPALLLVGLQDIGQHWRQEALKTPAVGHDILRPCPRCPCPASLAAPTYLERLQETGISVVHSIFPFSHFWCPEMVPDGFSVMILYLRSRRPSQRSRPTATPPPASGSSSALTSLPCSCVAPRRA